MEEGRKESEFLYSNDAFCKIKWHLPSIVFLLQFFGCLPPYKSQLQQLWLLQ